jgi:hypothetical protein
MTTRCRVGTVSIHDTELRVWEETVNETEFRDVVWNPLIRFMRKRGWTIGQDGSVHRCIRALYRLGHKGGLECQMHIAGRCIEVHIWSTDWPSDNCNGHQHCFNIRRKMPYLTGLRTDLELRALKAFLLIADGLVAMPLIEERLERPQFKIGPESGEVRHLAANIEAVLVAVAVVGRPVR